MSLKLSPENRSIGQAAKELGLSVYTLHYYEKIGLSSKVTKDSSGHRRYSQKNIDQLRFIKRVQRMHFSLDEIKALLNIEEANLKNKQQAQHLVREKLDEIEVGLQELTQLKTDLSGLLNACINSTKSEQCPIIDGFKENV